MSEKARSAEECRKMMNNFNFEGLYVCQNKEKGIYHDEAGKLKLATSINDPNNIIKTYEEVMKQLSDNFTLGIISNGNHGLDLIDIYNKDKQENEQINYTNFKDNKVMIVYDSPANNLEDIFGYNNGNIQECIDHAVPNTRQYLCKHLWRSKDSINCDCKNYSFYGEAGAYGQFLVSFMNEFRLKNVYTTNMFRYEVVDKSSLNKRGKELFVSYSNLMKEFPHIIDKVFSEVFLSEIKCFSPEVIFATTGVYNYLINSIGKINEVVEGVKIFRIPHPSGSCRINSHNRYILNYCEIVRGRYKAEIIDKCTATKCFKKYLEHEFKDSYKEIDGEKIYFE